MVGQDKNRRGCAEGILEAIGDFLDMYLYMHKSGPVVGDECPCGWDGRDVCGVSLTTALA